MTAHLGPGQLLLVHGGASGIGTHAIQVARALGARVAVTAGSPDKLALTRELGAQITISYKDEDFVARINEETDGAGADVILDIMGAAYLDRNIEALASDGQLVVIGLQGGVTAELNLGKLMAKRARVMGTTLRARPVTGPNSKSAIVDAVTTSVWPMFASDRVRPIIGARAAHPAGRRGPSAVGVGQGGRKDRAYRLAARPQPNEASARTNWSTSAIVE